ncbi:hypothetical protein [Alteribacillus sp. HJP-4]
MNGMELHMSEKYVEDLTVYIAYDDLFKENDCIPNLVEVVAPRVGKLEEL